MICLRWCVGWVLPEASTGGPQGWGSLAAGSPLRNAEQGPAWHFPSSWDKANWQEPWTCQYQTIISSIAEWSSSVLNSLEKELRKWESHLLYWPSWQVLSYWCWPPEKLRTSSPMDSYNLHTVLTSAIFRMLESILPFSPFQHSWAEIQKATVCSTVQKNHQRDCPVPTGTP